MKLYMHVLADKAVVETTPELLLSGLIEKMVKRLGRGPWEDPHPQMEPHSLEEVWMVMNRQIILAI